ncbi:MAG: ElyC/SanA/YdcF family protein [Rhodothermales bacterium]
MFLLKKLVSSFLNPVPVCLMILCLGVLLLWVSKSKVWGRRLTTFGFVLLLLFSYDPIPGMAVRALEQEYAVFSPAQYPGVEVKWVVVLSGGIRDETTFPPNDQISAVSLSRLVEGVRVLQFYPEAHLLLTGGGFESKIPEAAALKGVTELLGKDPARVRLEQESLDTHDQAVRVRQMVGEDPVVLVTSAVHLPRAMALFKKQGVNALPAPAHHLVRPKPRIDWGVLFPKSGNLTMLNAAWHEYLGMMWATLRGQM